MSTENTPLRSPAMDEDVISLSEIIAIILDGKWWISGITALFLTGALFYIWVATPVYRSDALIQVEDQKSPLGGLMDLGDAFGGETPSETEVEVIRSRFVLGKVVEREKLDVIARPKYFPVIGYPVARRFTPLVSEALLNERFNSPLFGLDSYAWGGERIAVERFTLPTSLEGEKFTLTALENGHYSLELENQTLLEGKVGEAANDHNGQIALFISELSARTGTRFEITRLPLVSAIENLSAALSVSEKGKKTGVLSLAITGPEPAKDQRILEAVAQRYLRQNVERVSAEAQNSLKFLEDQLPQVKEQLDLSEARLNNFRLENKTVDLTLETKAVLEQAVILDTKLSTLNIQLEQVGKRYTVNHPIMQELMLQKAFLQDRKKEFVEQTENLPSTQQEVLRLARDVEVNTAVYTELLNKAQELKIVKASAVGNVRILDHALTAIKPVKPKKSLIVVLAALLGAMLGAGFVFIRDMLKQGVKTPEEIESRTGLSVYASVPLSDQQDILERNAKKQGGGYLLSKNAPGDLAVESLRSLRTNLVFALMEAEDNRIMITGPSPGVGKSFVSANLGALLAESGQKVLLIDADMRKGHVGRAVGLNKEAHGLAECIVGKTNLASATNKVSDDFFVLPTGMFPPNPSELLMSPAFKELLDNASEEYDVVLVDTPPILAVTDPAIVGKLCSTSFMVVRAELNPIKEVEYAATRLQQTGVVIKGCVLNGMVQSSSRYGNYGYYQYAYESK